MPVATAAKIEALTGDLGSQSALADLLGVSRSRVSRWLRGDGIDPLNAERIDMIEVVLANLLRLHEPESAREWLRGLNPHLGDRQPVWFLRQGRFDEVLRAIRAERAGSFA